MGDRRLYEYKRGRYAWIDSATGTVIGLASAAEVAAALDVAGPSDGHGLPTDQELGQPAERIPLGNGPNPATHPDAPDAAAVDVAGPAGGHGLPTDQGLGQQEAFDELSAGPNLAAGYFPGNVTHQVEQVDWPTAAPLLAGGADLASLWLWLDPRRVAGYTPATFNPAAFLTDAIRLFQEKPWTGGQQPGRLVVHPSTLHGNGLETAAAGLGLEVIADKTTQPGTYRLALARRE